MAAREDVRGEFKRVERGWYLGGEEFRQELTQSLMPGSSSCLVGAPAHSASLTLTLGTDVDGGGLPDAWELELIARPEHERPLADRLVQRQRRLDAAWMISIVPEVASAAQVCEDARHLCHHSRRFRTAHQTHSERWR